ncbi:hypothetical protein IFO70_22135 [Phormidium tenue FACHB-886]|nr:hypothetical protein [Phormidium tenue FACHB-886]
MSADTDFYTFAANVQDLSKIEVKADGTLNITIKVLLGGRLTPISLLVAGVPGAVAGLASVRFTAPAGTQFFFQCSEPKQAEGDDFYTATWRNRFELRA